MADLRRLSDSELETGLRDLGVNRITFSLKALHLARQEFGCVRGPAGTVAQILI